MKAISIPTAMIVSVGLLACGDPHRPDPLGRLTGAPTSSSAPSRMAGEWAADCQAPLSIEGVVRGPDPLMKGGYDAPFQAAAMAYVCPHPGWSLYVDRRNRIVGLCVDDSVGVGSVSKPYEGALDRARPLLAKHVSVSFAADVTKDACSYLPQTITHGLRRWEQPLRNAIAKDGSQVYQSPVGTVDACCWEVIDP